MFRIYDIDYLIYEFYESCSRNIVMEWGTVRWITFYKSMIVLNRHSSMELSTVIRLFEFLPPANEVCEGYVFTCDCLSTRGGVPGKIPPWQVHPQAGSPPRQVHPRQVHTPLQVHPPGRYTPLGAVYVWRYGQQAGSTHPTGMHSCS